MSYIGRTNITKPCSVLEKSLNQLRFFCFSRPLYKNEKKLELLVQKEYAEDWTEAFKGTFKFIKNIILTKIYL